MGAIPSVGEHTEQILSEFGIKLSTQGKP
jgi:crotonobetainyl-CoA:carnitine CoA-transferase CaiB-like acyl-CoA transferase